jgi:hypothetical protein
MWLTIPDSKYLREYEREVVNDLKDYERVSGKDWGPYNTQDAMEAGFLSAEEWHKALKAAIAEARLKY